MNKLNLNVLKSNYPKKGLFYYKPSICPESLQSCREIAAGFSLDRADSLFFICRPKQVALKAFFTRVLRWINLTLKVEQVTVENCQAIKLVRFTSELDTEIFTLICRAYDIIKNADVKSWKSFCFQLLDQDLFTDTVLTCMKSSKMRNMIDQDDMIDNGGFCDHLESDEFRKELTEDIDTTELIKLYLKSC